MNTHDYEHSRPAFEAGYQGKPTTAKFGNGTYVQSSVESAWYGWCRALDWAAEQAQAIGPVHGGTIQYQWECLKCGQKDIPAREVTFQETHDNGCGGNVVAVLKKDAAQPAQEPPQEESVCIPCAINGPINCPEHSQVTKPQDGGAVEWVEAKLNSVLPPHEACFVNSHESIMLPLMKRYAGWMRELANRCDHAENQCNQYWLTARGYSLELKDLRAQLAKAQAERDALRGALDWLEEEAPAIHHDAWTCSVDMAGNRWTLRTRIDGPMQKFRGRTLIETIEKARAALAKLEQKEVTS